LIAEDKNWESLESFDAISALRVGQNVVLVEATNGGSGPNPAALYFEMKLIDTQGTVSIASSDGWTYSTSALDAQGKLADGISDWKKAVVANGPWAGRLQNEIAMGLARGPLDGPMVRASLIKADPLMRSLGRPNRDQIVSMRPTELTTLEAMDLSNGQTLADWLARGADLWNARRASLHADAQTIRETPTRETPTLEAPTRELIDRIYMHALSRHPRIEELQTIDEMIGPTLERTELEDILWSVVMLPEFQYVR
jgi:hypothetical protein